MPLYEYYCDANNRRVEVRLPRQRKLATWGELCYAAQVPLGDTDPFAPVRRVPTSPYVHVTAGNAELKEAGFTKLVKREQGVYENVTALEGEARYFKAGQPGTTPHLHKKIRD